MFTSARPRIASVCLCIFLGCSLLHAQASGSFSGTVRDKTGLVIAGAKVTVTSEGTGVTRESTTDASGHYLVPLLPVAAYTLRVESAGFREMEQTGVRLQVDESRELDFTLSPRSVTESVDVSAAEVAVETTNATLGQVITSEQVADLPLNGRNFVQLATLTPGTTAETSPVSFFNGSASSEASTRGSYSLSSGGSRAQETDWLLDGNDNNQLDEGGIAIFSSIDDIQEFKVLTYNYSAEYGERAGPTVLVTTKSGSNQLHGSLFEFLRNTALDASPFFSTSGAEKFNLNQFGGSLGGPIHRDKTYFFLDYQAKMQREGVTFTGYVPTLAMRAPDANGNYNFSDNPLGIQLTNPYTPPQILPGQTTAAPVPFQCSVATGEPEAPVSGSQPYVPGLTRNCNLIPGSMVNSIGAKVAALYPAPNASAAGYNYVNTPVRKLNEGTFDVRLDHNFSGQDSAFARFSYDQATNYVPGGSPTWSEANAFGSNQSIDNHGRNAVVAETHVFSQDTINQLTVGYSRIFNHILSFGTGTCEAAIIGIPGADLGSRCDRVTGYPASLNQSTRDCISCGLTSFQMSSYFSVGDRGFAPYQGGTNVYSISDVLDLVRGKHNIRFGAVFRANQMNVRNNASQDGFVVEAGLATGDDIGDLLLGSLGVFAAHDQTFLGGTTGRRWQLVRPFVQDDWRVTRNLTVNLGLAWALATPETEVENRQSNFDILTRKWYVPKGSPALSGCTVCIASDRAAGIELDKTALEPRVGFAWKPLKDEKTAVRGGYAIFHDSAWNQGGQGLWQNPPFYAEVDPFPTGICMPFGSTGCGLSTGFLVNGRPLTSPENPSAYTGTIQSANRDFKQGMVQQFNLNVERQVPGHVVLTVGYAGSRSSRILASQLNENVSSPSACGVVPGYTIGCGFGSFPYANPFQVVASNDSVGSARYDSLQVKAETKSTRDGLYALVGYTYSRNFDSGLTDGLGTNAGATYWPLPGAQRLDWGLSQLNLNNSFTASVLYELPFGRGKHFGARWGGAANAILGNWQVNVIERANSGFPLFVVDSADESGVFFSYNGFTFQRPDEVGDPNKPGPVAANPTCAAPGRIHTLANWFNPCAFEKARTFVVNSGTPQASTVGELGTAPRAPVYGPRFVNTDFSVIKNFPIPSHEGMHVQFRAELFNLLNHPQFFLPGVGDSGEQDINTPSSFGVISGTVNNPRLVQLALKLAF